MAGYNSPSNGTLPQQLVDRVRRHWLVCAQDAIWPAAIGRALSQSLRASDGLTVQCDSVADLDAVRSAIKEPWLTMIALEARADNLHDVLQLAASIRRGALGIQSIGLVDRGWDCDRSRLILALREAGAADVATSPRAVADCVALGLRHAAATQPQTVSLVEFIWQSLPWQQRQHRYR